MENKTSKYLKYAIGEIILVVIGILIALNINNWNESQNSSKKEIALLRNLKNDIDTDIINLKQQDSVFSILETKAAKGIKLFYKAKTVADIDSVSKLTDGYWNVLYINNNTYNEMVNSGNMYTMKNKYLQKQITAYYLNVEADKNYIKEVNNEQGHLFNRTPEFYPFKFLISQLRNPQVNLKMIDTTWITDLNSTTYITVAHYLENNQEINNVYRRSVFKRNMVRAEKLLTAINDELQIRSN